jgi:hypothetical protein
MVVESSCSLFSSICCFLNLAICPAPSNPPFRHDDVDDVNDRSVTIRVCQVKLYHVVLPESCDG